jgi:hypothetical protein
VCPPTSKVGFEIEDILSRFGGYLFFSIFIFRNHLTEIKDDWAGSKRNTNGKTHDFVGWEGYTDNYS